ncbi:UNVERIFIED_ORG: hypothetical protein GGD51_000672 [Rhizobium esperanzae]
MRRQEMTAAEIVEDPLTLKRFPAASPASFRSDVQSRASVTSGVKI